MNIRITPKKLSGDVQPPASKSVAHRLLIAAALADGRSVIDNVYPSKDILATIDCMRQLGADITLEGSRATVTGISEPPKKATLDCGESGSTLRFLIPVACALGVETTFIGHGRLPERPITPYLEELPKHGITFGYNGTMPFTVKGKLTGGEFRIAGDISSQFITGLLLAFPLIEGESRVILTSKLESKPYVDITRGCLEQFGCKTDVYEDGFGVNGTALAPCSCEVEGDYSQAAFFVVANALGSNVNIQGVNVNSFQGDKKIVEICDEMVYNNNGMLRAFSIDCSDIPDLVPILSVLGCFCEGTSHITNAARLRIKECDRLSAMAQSLNACGGKVTELEDGLVIEGVGELTGGTVPDFNDHRIPMAMAVAATRSSAPITILGAQCVSKSYPDFFEVYERLGGVFEEV
ncbi:3-phosphoshikimate 1-carboxyvinyltransferase [Ruminococcus sp. YE71]|uniref:3-phosphoshikimate 1-carboxyvinyltransferase n=1 Tax=unclassified Ruminococcus TaxID=2608920 RepID=UPI00087FBCB9|nr:MULTISPECIES: 3-phosphoshikimate 1-carboxyvinyltransferase [unclassified Ruminococcus]SDA14134.1 3-phosphoshikimate 1-carboxyvinyltransferase [Ruminococcus sp. YE78]SFW20619.1 3-phosphoshikimate 1-carboxyvinyltransferase [Ruminococcus sp. YE71]